MVDLERFETDLTALIYAYDLDDHVGIVGADLVARRLMEFIEIMKVCHEQDRDVELSLAPDRQPLLPPHLEALLPDTGATSARRRTVHIEQHDVPEPPKIEALPATEDWCACGWSDEPHLRSEHEPTTPPCPKFVSRPGEFAAGPDSICATCAETGRAHGITTIGPPTQIAETLTPLED